MANFGAGIIHIADVGSVLLSDELLEGTGPSAMELFQSQRSEPLTTLKIATQLVHKLRLRCEARYTLRAGEAQAAARTLLGIHVRRSCAGVSQGRHRGHVDCKALQRGARP